MIRKEVDILARGARQFAQISHSQRRRFPARQRFVNGLDTTEILRYGGQGIALLSIQVVAHTHFDFIERVEHVQLGKRHGSEAVDLCRISGGKSIEPPATSRTPGRSAILTPPFANQLAQFSFALEPLSRTWAFANPRRKRHHRAEHPGEKCWGHARDHHRVRYPRARRSDERM